MAIDTFERRVRAQQRKSIFVCFDFLRVLIPAVYGVALLAVGAELAPMDVCVAIGALHSHVFELEIGMALRTRHARVHSPQRITRLVVIELGDTANRFPTCGRMAIFAGDRDRTMRVACRTPVRLRPGGPLSNRQKKQRIEQEREGDRFPHGFSLASLLQSAGCQIGMNASD